MSYASILANGLFCFFRSTAFAGDPETHTAVFSNASHGCQPDGKVVDGRDNGRRPFSSAAVRGVYSRKSRGGYYFVFFQCFETIHKTIV